VASDVDQQGREVHGCTTVLIDTDPLGQTEGDEALPKDVLHRLPEPEVDPQRKGRDQLGQTDRRSTGRISHIVSVRTAADSLSGNAGGSAAHTRENGGVLRANDLSIELGDRPLLRAASFAVHPGDKIGLVGANGAGKSSLLSVLMGTPSEVLAWSGDVEAQGEVASLPQDAIAAGLGAEPTGLDHILSAKGLDKLEEDRIHARRAMEADPSTQHIEDFTHAEEAFGAAGGYAAEAEVLRLCAGIGVAEELLIEDIRSLSGGQRRKIDLVRALFQEAPTLILDEPTNHLDIASKKWLMGELERYPGGLLVVSHDIELLGESISRVFRLFDARLDTYKGTYRSCMQQIAEEDERRGRMATREQKEIKRLTDQADSMRGSSEKRARKAKVLDRRVERLEGERTEVRRKETDRVFNLPVPTRSGRVVAEVEGLAVAYDGKVVLKDIGFVLERGDRCVVLGRNGAGKSSLLRCLVGDQEPTKGTVTLGSNVEVGYFSQLHEQLEDGVTAYEHLADSSVKADADKRTLLGAFGITGDMSSQTPDELSGGERVRLGLAVLAARQINLLVLDEVTNNLDPRSRRAIGGMFRRWKGTMLVVTHELELVRALKPTRTLMLPEGRYTYWDEEDLGAVPVT
jgi:ATPase subunit of ABC transporter with duplicated ATPase domains